MSVHETLELKIMQYSQKITQRQLHIERENGVRRKKTKMTDRHFKARFYWSRSAEELGQQKDAVKEYKRIIESLPPPPNEPAFPKPKIEITQKGFSYYDFPATRSPLNLYEIIGTTILLLIIASISVRVKKSNASTLLIVSL